MRLSGLALLAMACGGEANRVERMCAGEEGDPTVWLGTGVGGLFEPLPPGADVGLDVAPQGGFGVSVQVQTLGLQTDGGVTVQLDTEIDGVNSGAFTNTSLFLFCRDDGRGTLGGGVAVGFDPEQYTADNLDTLDGRLADLVVTVTDGRGVSATTRQSVSIRLGASR